MIFLAGPGHGAPGVLGPVYLEGTYSEIYTDKCEDEEGLREFFKQFSFPGGIGSHCTPETPGSIHEGRRTRVCAVARLRRCVRQPRSDRRRRRRRRRSETGPLATSWHIGKFLNPIRDGAVLPILHLNGYKINNPTLLARISHEEFENLLPRLPAGRPTSSRVPTPRACTRRWPLLSTLRFRDPQGQQEARAPGRQAPPLADDRAAHAERLDQRRRGRRSQARRLLARPPGADGGREEKSRPPEGSRRLDAGAKAGGAVRREWQADSSRNSRHWRRPVSAAWARTRTPTADSSRRRCGCRTSGTTP
jgi:hypothetical protein